MGNYRKDFNLTKKTLSEESLNQFNFIITQAESALNKKNAAGYCFITYIIRYDNKGYRLFDFSDVLRHYKLADRIEKISLNLYVSPDMPSNMSGEEMIEIFFANGEENSYIVVEGDNQDWVNATYVLVDDVLRQCKSRFSWVKGAWVPLMVQMLGVLSIFTFSLVFSYLITPLLNIENPFFISFIFGFLLLSNIWGYVNPIIMQFMKRSFPNIYFQRNNKKHLSETVQNIVATWLIPIILVALSLLYHFLYPILKSFLK